MEMFLLTFGKMAGNYLSLLNKKIYRKQFLLVCKLFFFFLNIIFKVVRFIVQYENFMKLLFWKKIYKKY